MARSAACGIVGIEAERAHEGARLGGQVEARAARAQALHQRQQLEQRVVGHRGDGGVAGAALRAHREAEGALLGAADAEQAAVAIGDDRAGALVEQEVAADEVGRSCVRYCAPWSPPTSSSTTLMIFSSPRGGRQPSRASAAPATTSAAVWDFMSIAPRPHTWPSCWSPDHGSRDQSSGEASTVSTCER